MSTPVRAAALLTAVLFAGILPAATRVTRGPEGSAGERATVVVELFTSQGCSSCPPADDLLREWLTTQPVAGVEIVGLSEHVDYWNRLGWRDPYSSPAFSARQSAYDAAVFRSQRIYTPQLVIDGRLDAVGSDARAVRRAIVEAAREPKARLDVSTSSAGPDRLQVQVTVHVPPEVRRDGPAEVALAIVENGLSTHVGRGENGGRTLRHAAVTRSLSAIGAVGTAVSDHTVDAMLSLSPDWSLRNVRVIALLQERGSRRIIGVRACALPWPAGDPARRFGVAEAVVRESVPHQVK